MLVKSVELLTPVLPVADCFSLPPETSARYRFGIGLRFGKKEYQPFQARLCHAKKKIIGSHNTLDPRPPFWRYDTVTGEASAWFLAEDRPPVVDSALTELPPTLEITTNSRVRVDCVVVASGKVLFLVARAVQIVELLPPSIAQKTNFGRIEGGYVYSPPDQAPVGESATPAATQTGKPLAE